MALRVCAQESLSSLRSDQTTIIVAHRLSTVMDADIIIVMQVWLWPLPTPLILAVLRGHGTNEADTAHSRVKNACQKPRR